MSTTRHADGGGPAAPAKSKGLALAVIAVAQLLIVLDLTIVNVALPSLEADLGVSVASRSWVVTLYALAFGGLLLLGGRVADYIGRRRSLTIGLLAFGASSVLGALAPNPTVLFVARFLQGASAALLAPSALSLLAVTFTEPRERARAFAVFGTVVAAGGAIGLLAGGILTEYLSWRWCLGVATPVALVTAVAGRAVFSETRADTAARRFDVAGGLTGTGGLVALVVGLSEADRAGWGSAGTIALLAAAVGLLVAFAAVETRSDDPLLPPRVVLDRNRGGAFGVQVLVGAALLSVFVFLTFYLQQTLEFSALETGVAFLPFAVGIGLGAGAYAVLSSRLRPGVQVPVGLVASATGLALLTGIGAETSYWSHVLGPLVLTSFGIGLVIGPVQNIALVGVTDRDAGVASAMVDTTQQVGSAVGTALLNTVFAGAISGFVADAIADGGGPGQALQAAASLHGYHVAFWVAAGLLVAGAVVAALLIDVTPKQMAAAAADRA